MKYILILIFFCSIGSAQEARKVPPAHTREECNADVATWNAENDTLSHKSLSMEQINNRSKELLFCELDYPTAPEKSKWTEERGRYADIMSIRYQNFLRRHDLFYTFLDEDQRGER